PKTTLTLGLSYNGLKYDVSDYLQSAQSGVKHFKGEFSPRIALSYDFGEFLTLHSSISTGFAPPTGSEIQNADGSINRNIGAEKAVNYEINAKGNILDSRLAYNLSLYKMDTAGRRDLLHMLLTSPTAFVRYVGANHPSDYSRLEDWIKVIKE